MTEALAFDTHQFVKTLMDEGFSQGQAEALATAQAAVLDKNLVTRRDIEEIRLEIEKVKTEVQRIKADLLKWMIGAMIAQSAVIVALVRLP